MTRVYSPQGALGGELYRISPITGRVLQRWAMPSVLRPLLAVDEDGLWLSQSLYSGVPSHIPAGQRADYRSIYRVAAGMRTPVRARQLGGSRCGQYGSAPQTIAGTAAAGVYCLGSYAGGIRGFGPDGGALMTQAPPTSRRGRRPASGAPSTCWASPAPSPSPASTASPGVDT